MRKRVAYSDIMVKGFVGVHAGRFWYLLPVYLYKAQRKQRLRGTAFGAIYAVSLTLHRQELVQELTYNHHSISRVEVTLRAEHRLMVTTLHIHSDQHRTC